MSKEYLEAFKIVYNNFDYLISDVCIENDDVNICLKTIKEQLPTIKQALQRLEAIDNANPSEALECLERIGNDYFLGSKDCTVKKIYEKEYNTIKQVLIERIVWKNIHNTKVKTPLVSIFEGLSKDERFKFTEHIYYHWEEMKEALEDKNSKLEKENVELKAKAQKEHKALEIIKKKTVDIWLIQNKKTLKQYNSMVDESRQLTEEEFNLLKEVLK